MEDGLIVCLWPLLQSGAPLYANALVQRGMDCAGFEAKAAYCDA